MREQHLVQNPDQLRPVLAHGNGEALRLQRPLDRRGDLEVADLAMADVVDDRKDVVHQPGLLAGGHRHQRVQQVGVGSDVVVRIGARDQLLRRVPADHGDALILEVAQAGDEPEVVAGDDHVDIVQVGLGEGEELLALRGGRERQHRVQLVRAQLALDRLEIQQLIDLELEAQSLLDELQVVRNDADEVALAVLELVGRVVAFRADADHVVLGEPRGLFGGQLDGRRGRNRRRTGSRRGRGVLHCGPRRGRRKADHQSQKRCRRRERNPAMWECEGMRHVRSMTDSVQTGRSLQSR